MTFRPGAFLLALACALAFWLGNAPPGRAENTALELYINEAHKRMLEQQRLERLRHDAHHRRTYSPAPIVVQDQPVQPKVDPGSFIVVMGDSLAGQLARGLEQVYADNPAVAITDKEKPSSGLVRTDFFDWPKAVQELLASDEKISVGVVMLGINDRQAIREGDVSDDPGTDRWKEIYTKRIDAIAQAFAARKVPLVWVGLPPMKSDKLSADVAAFNAFFRDRVQRAGGTFVDLWTTFVNDQNAYTASGPGMDGQIVRLRTSDGVHFTKAGALKAAHFADVEIKRLLKQEQGTTVVDLPAQPADAARLIDQSIPALPEPPGAIPLAAKPIAGPILPLTSNVVPAPDGKLIAAPTSATAAEDGLVRHVLRDGLPPPPQPGRADDFYRPGL